MKNRLIITISDVHGSKQYSVHEIIKNLISWIIAFVLFLAVGTYLYIAFLNNQVSDLNFQKAVFKEEIVTLNQTSQTYREQNRLLNKQNIQLAHLIQEGSDKLTSVNRKLKEVEDELGFGPDLNASFQTRLEEEREETAKIVRKKILVEQVGTIQKALLLNGIPNGKPVSHKRITSKFGYRIHPVTKKPSYHPAIDFSTRVGTPVYAPASGIVAYAAPKNRYGNLLVLEHSYGFKTAYGHLSRFAVKRGAFVNKGDIIAYTGNTGRSTGPHLHYEVRYLNKWLNPQSFIDWNLDNINEISDKITKVDWESILAQTQKLITLSTQN